MNESEMAKLRSWNFRTLFICATFITCFFFMSDCSKHAMDNDVITREQILQFDRALEKMSQRNEQANEKARKLRR